MEIGKLFMFVIKFLCFRVTRVDNRPNYKTQKQRAGINHKHKSIYKYTNKLYV